MQTRNPLINQPVNGQSRISEPFFFRPANRCSYRHLNRRINKYPRPSCEPRDTGMQIFSRNTDRRPTDVPRFAYSVAFKSSHSTSAYRMIYLRFPEWMGSLVCVSFKPLFQRRFWFGFELATPSLFE